MASPFASYFPQGFQDPSRKVMACFHCGELRWTYHVSRFGCGSAGHIVDLQAIEMTADEAARKRARK